MSNNNMKQNRGKIHRNKRKTVYHKGLFGGSSGLKKPGCKFT